MYRKTIKGWWKNVLFLSKVKLLVSFRNINPLYVGLF